MTPAAPLDPAPRGLIAAVVERFLGGQLAIIVVIAALCLGLAAILLTPREEDPQIVVPLADIVVAAPGASAEEVEQLVTTPLERFLWQIDGVEYVYSVSHRDQAVVTVRFFVGEDREASLIKLHNRLQMHLDQAPPIVASWLVRPIEIDDVPIITLTLHSRRHDDHALHRIGTEVLARLERIPDISRTAIHGGRRRVVAVTPDVEALHARGLSLLHLRQALAQADGRSPDAAFDLLDARQPLSTQPLLRDAEAVAEVVVGVHNGVPVSLREVAAISDGPEEPHQAVRMGRPGWDNSRPAVTLALAKKRGTNAVVVADAVIAAMQRLDQEILPDGVEWDITRNYGATADAKVDELLSSLLFAMISVVGLLLFTLGWREGLIVALAVPISFALALFVNYAAGYTINRVTLFALILTLGLVVDDPITNVDNIQRHILLGRDGPRRATLRAVSEVLPPVIMSTLAIIVSFLPMFFITGMMGPYMQPMAVNVPLTVVFSTVAALSVVPWAAHRLLRHRRPSRADDGVIQETRLYRLYAAVMTPLLDRRWARWSLLGGIVMALGVCGLLVILRQVPMKMLPFDNKDELQLVIDLPEGSTLDHSRAVVAAFERQVATIPEVVAFQSYTGTHSPIDFNGLVRHHYFRQQPHQADLRLILRDKAQRQRQSHAIALAIRPDLEALAERLGVRLQIIESPPGPPVVATVVAEVYGGEDRPYADLVATAQTIADHAAHQPGLHDISISAEAPRRRLDLELDQVKAALHGLDAHHAAALIHLAVAGQDVATLHRHSERHSIPVRLRLAPADRAGPVPLGRLGLPSADGSLVTLAEIGRCVETAHDQPIYRKNLQRVAYVFADSIGVAPAESVIDLAARLGQEPLADDLRVVWSGEGEWKITVDVFRDLGLAFGAAMIGIYILLVIQTGSFALPLVVMSAIPLTAIGIIPGFWLLNRLAGGSIGGHADPIFFTATAMIGMIALGGIVVRNAIVLIEFIQDGQDQGLDRREAILASGAVRMRPILLTAATTALGAWPITLDPIFSGLAWALIFGLLASTAFTLVVVPTICAMLGIAGKGGQEAEEET